MVERVVVSSGARWLSLPLKSPDTECYPSEIQILNVQRGLDEHNPVNVTGRMAFNECNSINAIQ